MLPPDWDSYGSRPLSSACKSDALLLVDTLEQEAAIPLDAIMSADSDLIIKSRIGPYKLKCLMDTDGDIGIALTHLSDEPSFHDITIAEVPAFLRGLNIKAPT